MKLDVRLHGLRNRIAVAAVVRLEASIRARVEPVAPPPVEPKSDASTR